MAKRKQNARKSAPRKARRVRAKSAAPAKPSNLRPLNPQERRELKKLSTEAIKLTQDPAERHAMRRDLRAKLREQVPA